MKKGFIIGNPRSGTSLFRLMLNAHPQIIAPQETGFLHWWHKKYSKWKWEYENYNDLSVFISDLKSSKKIETWRLDYNLLKDYLIKKKPNSYEELGESIYLFYAQSIHKEVSIIADKNNYYINHLEDLSKIWPDAFYIYIVRDGRDVACSYIEINELHSTSPYKPLLPIKIEEIANEWNQNNIRIKQFLSKAPKHKYLIIKYENIVQKTEKELKKVCDFLQIDFDKNMLNYYSKKYHDESELTIDWKKKTLQPPDINAIGRHKLLLNDSNKMLFNKIAYESLSENNYDI